MWGNPVDSCMDFLMLFACFQNDFASKGIGFAWSSVHHVLYCSLVESLIVFNMFLSRDLIDAQIDCASLFCRFFDFFCDILDSCVSSCLFFRIRGVIFLCFSLCLVLSWVIFDLCFMVGMLLCLIYYILY